MTGDERSAVLSGRIREEIREAGGAIPFERFMARALYEPGLGYYEHAEVGRRGDFYTSVSVGSLFGELNAADAVGRFERLAAEGWDGVWRWVEAGAHDGRFAADFLGWMREHAPEVYGRVRYGIVEPSARRRAWQESTLAAHAGRVEWHETVPEFEGILFSNELLDAFPLDRLGWDRGAGRWFRWGVAERGGFVWARLEVEELAGTPVAGLPAELLAVLPDGYTVEWSPGAEAWWRGAVAGLGRGWAVAFDYGYEAGDRFRPERVRGTLRGYRGHRHVDDVLEAPGLSDLTAHVDFGRVEAAGLSAGARTECLENQGRHLTRVLQGVMGRRGGFEEWGPARVRQFQTLTHPQHLGHSFRVLVQERG